jgi:surface antigen
MKIAALLCASTIALSGCATNGPNEQSAQAAGMLIGALLGAALGKTSDTRWIGALAGATAGSMIGGSIGRHLDEVDRLKAQAATSVALRQPSSATVEWKSDKNHGVAGVVSTSAPASSSQGTCKNVTHLVNLNGKEHREDTRLCQRSDGSWAAV